MRPDFAVLEQKVEVLSWPGDLSVGVSLTNFNLGHTSVTTEDIYLKFRAYAHYQKSNLYH